MLTNDLKEMLKEVQRLLPAEKPMGVLTANADKSDAHRLAYNIAKDMLRKFRGRPTMQEEVLENFNGKFKAIKRIKQKFDLGLKEAKQFVDWVKLPPHIKRIPDYYPINFVNTLLKDAVIEDDHVLLTPEDAKVFDLIEEVIRNHAEKADNLIQLTKVLWDKLNIQTTIEKVCMLRDQGFEPATIEELLK